MEVGLILVVIGIILLVYYSNWGRSLIAPHVVIPEVPAAGGLPQAMAQVPAAGGIPSGMDAPQSTVPSEAPKTQQGLPTEDELSLALKEAQQRVGGSRTKEPTITPDVSEIPNIYYNYHPPAAKHIPTYEWNQYIMVDDPNGGYGDNMLCNKMIDNGLRVKQGILNRCAYDVNSFRPFVEQELQEHANSVWWDNDDLENEM